MPVVELPADFNSSMSINATGPGVAAYVKLNSADRADIYVGLILDGYTKYRDISLSLPFLKMQFYDNPTLACQSDDIQYNADRNKLIAIKVCLLVVVGLNLVCMFHKQ